MTTPHKISQWLSGTPPEAFEIPALRAVVEKYPYFWPAGLLRLSTDDEEIDFTTAASLRALYVPAPLRVLAELASLPIETPDDSASTPETELELPSVPSPVVSAPTFSITPAADADAAHSLEHDPLEDAVATTFGAEEGGAPHNTAVPEESPEAPNGFEEPLPHPLFTSDYFSHQGVAVENALPDSGTLHERGTVVEESDADRGLMVMRSFTDWMTFFQRSTRAAQEEEESKRAVRAMWQKEKLAAALQEEEEEIPEEVFQMAVASIEPDMVASEPLAEILAAQGKWERAVEMYRKLATKEPSKSAYFARKIEALESRHADL